MKLSSIEGPTKPSEACFTSGGGLDTIFRVTYYCPETGEALATMRYKTSYTAPRWENIGGSGEGVAVGPGGCYIATACYGTPIHEDLDTLRRFRDNCLPKDLVTLYYKTSPPIANFIKEKDWLRFLVRQPIRLIVKGLKLKDQTNQKITT